MAYTDDWESLMNGVFGPGGRFKAAPGTSAPKTGGSAALPDLNAALLEQQKRLDELLKQQNAQLKTQSDATAAALKSSRQMLRDMEDEGLLARGTTDVKPEHLGSFEGLAAEVRQTVLGQDAFVDSVVRAMRRPFVLGTEALAARNVILLTGGAGTGRHFALEETARCMAARGLLQSDRIATLDLALYPNSGAEKLFLQDLYAALHAPGEILAFEHYESCYPGFLKTLSDLAVKGSAPLSSRYLVNKEGILVDAGTALAPGAVSRIDPCGKYLIFYSHKGREALADKFGAALVSALGDVCETAPYTREDLAALAAQQLNALAQKIRARLGLTLSAGADVRDYVAAQCTAQKGAAGLAECCDRIFRALSEYCLQTDAKLTGTVAYDALKNDDGTITEFSGWFAEEEAVNAYLKAVGRTNESYQTLNKKQREEILGTYVVPITSPGTFVDYTSYQVYTKTAEMTSYGYMTRDANTCVNSTYKRQNGTWGYVGGYDLMISDLVQELHKIL